MHVIWKRPDGFHEASPIDFTVIELEGHSRIWLHNSDKDQYPFRISGGWEDDDGTVKLNNFINLLPCSEEEWLNYLLQKYNNSLKDNPKEFYTGIIDWLQSLKKHLKGDTWEVDIMVVAIDLTSRKLNEYEADFLQRVVK